MRYSIVFFDSILLISSLAALFCVIFHRNKQLQFDIRFILSCLLTFNVLYGLCLFLEWADITHFLETYEDLIGAMIPMMWAFFIYAILQIMAGKELKKSEDRYRRLFEQSNDLIVIHQYGKIIDVNQKMCDMLGYSREQLLEMSIPDLHYDDNTRQESIERVENLQEYSDKIFEGSLIKANGELIYVEVSTSIIELEKGIGQGIIRDISERMNSEKMLRDSERRYRLLAEYANDVIFTLDFKLNYTYVSPSYERLRGYRPEEVIGKKIDIILTPESQKVVKALFEEVYPQIFKELNGHREFRKIDIETYHKNGSTIWCEVVLSIIYGKENKPVGILGVARDISERKQAEQEKKLLEQKLRQTQKMEAIGTLAGGIAHDFNNILSIIFGFIDLALMDIDSPERITSDLDELKKAALRAKELIKQILTISRQTEQEKQPVRISLIADEALKLLRSTIPSSIEMRNEISSRSAVLADATQIHQIIMNLCTNAYHAMGDKGGILTVSVKDFFVSDEDIALCNRLRPGLYVRIEVSDTGHGMDEKTKERIFEPYFTTKKTGEGTGLGLAVVHGIVESNEGVINVYSEVTAGTSFHIYLPVYGGESVQGEIRNEIQYNMKGEERILFIDDEKIITDIANDALSRYGYKVTVFPSSINAFEKFKKTPSEYDLIITDMTMPGMNGLDLAENIRELRPNMPIILCSGHNKLISLQKIKDMGIQFIAKPIIMSELIHTIRLLFDQENYDE